MAHSSRLKYFLAGFDPDFERDFFLDPEGSGSDSGSTAGGVATSKGVMGGGGGIVEAESEGEVDRIGVEGAKGEDAFESFSQTMSGVQIRSGSDRTSNGGARSASR